MSVATPRCIDSRVLSSVDQVDRARTILGEDTPSTRLFNTTDLPTYRLIPVEFLSTFHYRAHQAVVTECIVTTISGRGQSQEWVTMTKLFYLHSLMTGRPCNLAQYFASYYVSFYHRQERGALWGSAFVTHLAHSRGMFHLLQELAAIEPHKLDRRTLLNIKLAADIPGLGLRFIGSDGRAWQQAQLAVMAQQQPPEYQSMPKPDHIREEPVQSPPHEDPPPQHPPHVYHAVRCA
ncbi:hypothetical protein R6Q57_003068 [Mikania cordata]